MFSIGIYKEYFVNPTEENGPIEEEIEIIVNPKQKKSAKLTKLNPKETKLSLSFNNNELPKSIDITKVTNKIKNNINGVIFNSMFKYIL